MQETKAYKSPAFTLVSWHTAIWNSQGHKALTRCWNVQLELMGLRRQPPHSLLLCHSLPCVVARDWQNTSCALTGFTHSVSCGTLIPPPPPQGTLIPPPPPPVWKWKLMQVLAASLFPEGTDRCVTSMWFDGGFVRLLVAHRLCLCTDISIYWQICIFPALRKCEGFIECTTIAKGNSCHSKISIRASEMAGEERLVKGLASKHGDLRQSLEPTQRWMEKTYFTKASSDFHKWACMCAHTHTSSTCLLP